MSFPPFSETARRLLDEPNIAVIATLMRFAPVGPDPDRDVRLPPSRARNHRPRRDLRRSRGRGRLRVPVTPITLRRTKRTETVHFDFVVFYISTCRAPVSTRWRGWAE